MASPQSGFAIVTPASRGIGFAFARYLLQHTDLPIIATARRDSDSLRHRLLGGMENSAAEERLNVFNVDVTEESTVRSLADNIKQTHPQAPLRLALTVPGILHVEKSPSQIDAHAALESLKVNTIGPMLLMKHLAPFLPTRSSPLFAPCDGEVRLPQHAIYAMMAARVGSVSDNRMGGWYSYRASKAAVFQLAKTLDLYLEGKCADRAISLAMHPGTVKTDFTKSYQDGREMLSAEDSAERLLGVLCSLELEGRGRCWDWKGYEVRP
ncbi:short chain dehydrogenase [Aspergillus parasiticus SU-1]|uniref:Short chain dehydrogenase n=1 Tax=Aspergillus parasiticus (strain ATCC 56775 / NRRL 5862 / SRRC 143 / SU-1) TaxID=1403190 RepID=A0A0F0IIS5_ASPPU|nr:short chain dehydrogenase [Aspergillus parasiticus SU-1]